LPGVIRTRVGYCGGTLKDPTYHNLGDHTESIQVDYDPSKISFEQILDRIWRSHNPCSTAWSRQYMSAIFYDGEAQKKAIQASKARMEEKLGKPVMTAILPLGKFYLAEDYHQKYELRGTAELMREFAAIYPDAKDFVNSTAAARVNSYIGGSGSKEQLQAEIELLGLSPEGKKVLQKYVTR
jgi:methionine-S-sulfoxide reductase